MRDEVSYLRQEIDLLWTRDTNGRLDGAREPGGASAPHLVVGTAANGIVANLGREVPESIAGNIRRAIAVEPVSADPSPPPACLGLCRAILESALDHVELASGPSYVIPTGVGVETPASILRCGDREASALREKPEYITNWGPGEWSALVDGTFGPWAMALVEGRVVSICHSARLDATGAEAGAWTDPGYRRHGYAAAATAAWAQQVHESERVAFYSTSEANHASQRVAARLGAHLIGWTWRLSAAERPQ